MGSTWNIDKCRDAFGMEHPVIQAPMAGGATTPALVAAVCNAGALGSFGAAYLKPDRIADQICRVRALTSRPFNVNIFAGGYETDFVGDAHEMLDLLSEIHAILGLPIPELPLLPPDPFDDQLEVILNARPPVMSFTFGFPDRVAMNRIKAHGIKVIGTATTAVEARFVEQAGADAVVAQGSEAGAHRGTFLGSFESAMVPTIALVEQIRREVSIPVISSGGMMDGRDIAESIKHGAVAAQLGTAFLACDESGVSDSYKEALLTVGQDRTMITRAFSGRPARGIANAFTEKLVGREEIILPYPLQNVLTRPMRKAAAREGEPGYQSLWAGQGVARVRDMKAADLVLALAKEIDDEGGSNHL